MTELDFRINQAEQTLRVLEAATDRGERLTYIEACGYARSSVEGLLAYLKELKFDNKGVDTRPF